LLPLEQPARIKREAEYTAEALALLKELATEFPHNVSYQVVLGRALREESRLANMTNDFQKADDALRRSIELFDVLLQDASRFGRVRLVCICQLTPRWNKSSGSENTGENASQR
jgi:hypothetical protein